MYGIINKAIEDLVCENFGHEKWEEIKHKSGVTDDFFLSNETYDDAVTYQLAGATADVMNIPLGKVLEVFGEWWILRTGKEKYGSLMQSGGKNLKEFLINLPIFHNRIMLIYPKLTPPEFKVSDIEEESIHVHYFSKREGLQEFVRGLLQGLGKMYAVDATVELLKSRENGDTHEIFKVSW